MASITFQALLTHWDVLNTNLKTHLPAMPDLSGPQQEFEVMINDGQALAAQQNQLTASLRDLIVRRNQLTQRAGHLREYLEAGLRHQLGVDSQRLLEFQIRPRIRRRRPAPEEPPAPPVTPLEESA